MSNGLTKHEILIIVNRYIGVDKGYLGNFSYRTHADFYQEYCDLDIDPNEIDGTTRERFIQILMNQKPRDQAKIIHGVITRFPVDAKEAPNTRTVQLKDQLQKIATRIESTSVVSSLSSKITHEIVEQAIHDAELLLRESGAANSVDRIFTALHGYMESILLDAGINFDENPSMIKLFMLMKEKHQAFQDFGPGSNEIIKILRSLSAIIDALQPIRNKSSLAHPNKQLLNPPEAMLVINTAKTILHYLNCKIKGFKNIDIN